MPIQRKQQVLAKVEISEGSSSSPGASDAVQIFEPTFNDDVEVQRRVPAGSTLSRDFNPIGRQSRTITFKSDWRGSGDTSIAITPPEWGSLIQACGYRVGSLVKLTCDVIVGALGFYIGDIITQIGPISGVIVGIKVAGASVHRTNTTGAVLIVAMVQGGPFTVGPAAGTVASLSTTTFTAVADYEGLTYQPTSQKLTNVTTGAWSGGTPAAVGEVLKVESAGILVGSVQLINNNGSFLNIDVTQLFGVIANGYTLRNAAGTGTAVINADPTQIRTPSETIRHNLDGRNRDLLGARGDFVLAGESGGPMQFAWTFSGDLGPSIDALPITTSGLSTIRPPRLLGAFITYGLAAEIYRLPTKRVEFANGGTVSPNLDGNRPGGSTGSNVVDRLPAFKVTTDNLNGAFDWESARALSVPIRVAIILGTVFGNVMSIVAPINQVTEVNPSDSDGIATWDITLEPMRILESGDDELYISQL